MTRPSEVATPLVVALTAPPLVVLIAGAAVVLAALFGFQPLTVPSDLTLPEAAAIRDEAEVVRQLARGANPNDSGLVRRGMLSDGDYVLTPLEAAVAARHVEIVRLLLRQGAEPDRMNVQLLYCLAKERRADDIVALLNEHAPAGTPFDCEGVRLPL